MSTTTHSPAPPQPQPRAAGRLQLPPAINTQLAAAAALEAQKLFSPAMQTARQAGFPLGLPVPSVLQTPLQSAFMAPLGRPMHRAHPSLQFGAPGIPMTPGGQHQFPPHLLLPAQTAPFQPRSRRAPSISTGGPPKAPLGGPQRKTSPLPPGAQGSTAAPQAVESKHKLTKKVIVKLPVERTPAEGDPDPLWTRHPLPHDQVPEHAPLAPPEIDSMESHPMDWPRNVLPSTLDVFLPGKPAWDEIKRAIMEDKLSRLGVGKPQGPPSRLATALPHGRAASISSPADPALLFFKLNKLQEQQNASAGPSHTGTPSPQPQSISPQSMVARAQNRHGHSMSMAPQGANYFLPPIQGYESGPFNPFGPNAVLPRDQSFNPLSPIPMEGTMLHAPQGIVPSQAALLLPQSGRTSVASSRPDFARGFGLEIPEEDEEEADAEPRFMSGVFGQPRAALSEPLDTDQDADGEEADDDMGDDVTVPAKSRIHSRHQSKLSAALSLRSVGGVRSEGDVADLQKEVSGELSGDRSFTSERIVEAHVDEAVAEWTGSEDMRSAADVSAVESDGEWSNPSDEERARQDRLHRRMLSNGRDNETQTPRRLPNFPRPPVTDGLFTAPRITGDIDDDVISNPSEEEAIRAERSQPGSGRASRPLPPIPGHSRPGSDTYMQVLTHSRQGSGLGPYDGVAHSRVGSGQSLYPEPQPVVPEKKITLNPNAKPFVFGGRPSIVAQPEVVPPVVQAGHARQVSLNSTLNAAAQEFKPSFTFRPPPGVKPLVFPEHPTLDARPLPQPPIFDSSARAMQGREKRVRRSQSIPSDDESLDDLSDVESRDGRDNIATWSFPFASKTTIPSASALNPTAKEFTLASLPGANSVEVSRPSVVTGDYSLAGADEGSDQRSQSSSGSEPAHLALDDMSKPVSPTTLTPTLPEFKHPVSTNTVPASLFKKAALASQDDGPTRPQVRSRLSSREIMASLTRRSSLDDLNDLNVPSISRKVSKTMLIASDSVSPAGFGSAGSELISPPLSKTHHRASLSRSSSLNSMETFSSDDKSRLLFKTFADLLEDKFETFKRELVEAKALSAAASLPTEIISELVATIRNQADLNSDEHPGGTGTDLALIRSIIEESHLDIQRSIQADIRSLVASTMVNRSRSPFPAPDIGHLLEDSNSRTLVALDTIRSQLTARLDGISEAQRLQRIHMSDLVAQSMTAAANLVSSGQQHIDIDSMTAQLAQAVKPNISQLIDLASDKKETAMLIVKHLSPLLEPILHPATPRLDTDAIAGQIAAEISRIVPPVDQHSLKEQVADLVVERLDARLTVRDRAVNGDSIASRVVESLSPSLEPIRTLSTSLAVLAETHGALSTRADAFLSSQDTFASLVADIPSSIVAVSKKLDDFRAEMSVLGSQVSAADDQVAPALVALTAEIRGGNRVQRDRDDIQDRLLTISGDIQGSISALSGLLETSLEGLQTSQLVAQTSRRSDDDEIRALLLAKADLEKQLQTLSGSTSQLGLEKDSLQERVATMDAENRLLRAQLEDQRSSATEREIKLAKAETRATELSESLGHALRRLSSADDTVQANQKRILEQDSLLRELTTEKHQLRSKVDSLELKVSWSERDKEASLRALVEAQKERDAVVAQQEKWDDLNRTAQHIETLTKLMTESESEELRELKRIRDRSKVLEGEHQALQKRFKEQEAKLANLERSSTTMRQSIASASQKAGEWEKRAKDLELELDSVRDKVERAEDLRQRIEADYSLLKSHVEEKELEEVAYQDREQTLRAEAAQLQNELAEAKLALEKAKEVAPSVSSIRSPQPITRSSSYVMVNGHDDRPSSRATIYPEDARSGANTPTLNGKKRDVSYIPPLEGAWASIHAPASRTVRGVTYFRPPRAAAASPTPSVLSTVTRRNDGWWDAD